MQDRTNMFTFYSLFHENKQPKQFTTLVTGCMCEIHVSPKDRTQKQTHYSLSWKSMGHVSGVYDPLNKL